MNNPELLKCHVYMLHQKSSAQSEGKAPCYGLTELGKAWWKRGDFCVDRI